MYFKRLIAVTTVCLFIGVFNASGGKNKGFNKPNIILVMADDQGWGDMHYTGHPVIQTPNFDKMADEGLCFNHFYSAAPLCSPTRGSVLTGRTPNRYGVFKFGEPIRPQEITLANVLKNAGYTTGHFGKWHLGPVFSGSPVNPGACGFDEWFSAPNFYDNNPLLSREGIAVQTTGEGSMVTVDAAIEFIRKHSREAHPFLSVIWFGSPHAPFEALGQDKALYPEQDERLQNYYGEITAMDRAFGKLRQELKALGIDKNTILWYCSDNGGVRGVSESGGRGYKQQIYEGGLRVPAILEWPEYLTEHRISNVPAYTCDIYPTLLEIAGVKLSNQHVIDGISLVPLLDGKMEKRQQPIGFWQYPGGGKVVPSNELMLELFEKQKTGDMSVDSSKLELNAGEIKKIYPVDIFPGHAAWLDWPYKLHRIQDTGGGIKTELYKLDNDSLEENDLSGKETNRARSMMAQLEKWQLSVIKSLNGEDYK